MISLTFLSVILIQMFSTPAGFVEPAGCLFKQFIQTYLRRLEYKFQTVANYGNALITASLTYRFWNIDRCMYTYSSESESDCRYKICTAHRR
jgi:hypothetical protein